MSLVIAQPSLFRFKALHALLEVIDFLLQAVLADMGVSGKAKRLTMPS
jgi:hypothetical protein